MNNAHYLRQGNWKKKENTANPYMVLCSYANFRTSYRRIDGVSYYWILYDTFLSPQQLYSVDEILEKRQEAIDALGGVLWGYTSRDCMEVLERFFPDEHMKET